MFLNKVVAFNKDGYFNWKNAKGVSGGLASHENQDHGTAMKLWDDRKNRDLSSSSIVHLIQNKSEHKKWLETVFLISKFLIKNGQPLRGHEEVTDFDEGVSGGLYLNIMCDLVFQLRPDLAEIAKSFLRILNILRRIFRMKSSLY